MKKPKSGAAVSNLQVLEAISDQISIDIFNAIAKNVSTSDNLIQILEITGKQYYARSSKLLNVGLIKRKDGGLTLTSFGQLIYQAQLKIARAIHYSSALRMIDGVKSCAALSDNDQKKLIDKLIDDSEMKRLIT